MIFPTRPLVLALLIGCFALVCAAPLPAQTGSAQPAATETPGKDSSSPASLFDAASSDLPTFINAESLTLLTNEKRFTYSGNVEVKQGDMTLTAATLEGTYDDNNKIVGLVARKDVKITKGETMKGSGQRAEYDAKAETVVLTESPQLEQEGSLLTADLIRVFLKDNRSVAEGNVKVTLINKGGGDLSSASQQLKAGG